MRKTRIVALARPLIFAWALAALPTVALADYGCYYSKDQTVGQVSYSYMRCGYGRGPGTGELEVLDTNLYGGIARLAVADYAYLTAFYAPRGEYRARLFRS